MQLTARPTTTTDVVQKLVNCVVGLAGHIYYTDQIRDMSTAIMDSACPLFASLSPISGKESPANEGDDGFDVKSASIWSLRMIKGVLSQGGGSVTLEEVWAGSEGALAGRESDVRMEYVDALTTHVRSEATGEEEQNDGRSLARFLNMIHVPIFNALKRGDAMPQDYWSIWVLVLVLFGAFRAMEAAKLLPVLWRMLETVSPTATPERQACMEAIFLGFLAVVADAFAIPDLKSAVSAVKYFSIWLRVGNRSTKDIRRMACFH